MQRNRRKQQNGKDHTSVLYSVQKTEEFLQDKPYEKELIEDIIKNLKSST